MITWNGKIYTPSPLPWHLVEHEAVHLKQQGGIFGSFCFFVKYVLSSKFRLDSEVKAYRVQYKSFCQVVKDRNRQGIFLNKISEDLSGKMYNNIIGFGEARELIHSG